MPTLCLLAKDDPLCPPLAWLGALEAAAKSEGIVVAVTEHGGTAAGSTDSALVPGSIG